MKLRMAPNSLFAILLRSPWWLSLLPAAAIALASRALLPDGYVIFGALGALPFVVIAVIAARRQWDQPGAAETERTLGQLSELGWREFRALLEDAYARAGYGVTALPDGGAADLLLQREGRTTLVACRRWKAANQGAEPLRLLAQDRRARDASVCVAVSLRSPGEPVVRAARQELVELLHGPGLVALVRASLAAGVGAEARAPLHTDKIAASRRHTGRPQ